tara:strand:- start:9603 stop:9770 length:168 start_codon:yes stop_codon:yes gene_type:complete
MTQPIHFNSVLKPQEAWYGFIMGGKVLTLSYQKRKKTAYFKIIGVFPNKALTDGK